VIHIDFHQGAIAAASIAYYISIQNMFSSLVSYNESIVQYGGSLAFTIQYQSVTSTYPLAFIL
jgi:hypothetical protein